MQGKRSTGPLAVVVLAITLVGLSSRAVHAELQIDRFTVDGGGWTFSTGGTLSLGGTVGQPDAGTSAGSRLDLFGGFWLGGELSPPSSVDLPDSPDLVVPFHLLAGLPNPFTDRTGIVLGLPESRHVDIAVFDSGGRLVRSICDREMPAGRHRFIWDGRGQNGLRAASGVYLVRARAGADKARARLLLLR